MVKKFLGQQKKSFAQIQGEWEKIQALDVKSRLKAMRAIGHDLAVSYDRKEMRVEQLEFYIKIMRQIIQTRSFPQPASRFLSKLITDWLVLTGNEKSEIILKIAHKITVETACIGVADPAYFHISELRNDYSDKHYVQLMDQGKCFIFSTGADGIYNVQLRVVDALEPVLTNKEFKYVVDVSEPAIIHIPTGLVAVADPFFLDSEERRLLTPITPGNYKINVYLLQMPKEFESFYIVLCKTNKEASNCLSKVYEFSCPS